MALRLNPKEASVHLRERHGVQRSTVTLRNYRVKGGGPQFTKFGNDVFYSPEALDHWVEAKLTKPVFSTSQLPNRAA